MENGLGGGRRTWYGKLKNPYTILVGKFEDSLQLVKPRSGCVANMKAEKVSSSRKHSKLLWGGGPFKSSLPSSVPYANSLPWPSVL